MVLEFESIWNVPHKALGSDILIIAQVSNGEIFGDNIPLYRYFGGFGYWSGEKIVNKHISCNLKCIAIKLTNHVVEAHNIREESLGPLAMQVEYLGFC